MAFGGNIGEHLEVEAYTYLADVAEGGVREQTVVIAFAATKTMTFGIERHAGDEGEVDGGIVGEDFANGFGDAEALADAEVLDARVATKFEMLVIDDARQDDLLWALFEVLQRRHFVGERGVEKQRLTTT